MAVPIIVRLLSDCSDDQVIWAPDPVDSADLALDEGLRADLRAWDDLAAAKEAQYGEIEKLKAEGHTFESRA